MKNKDDVLEELADFCHDQWSNWMTYLFSKCYDDVGQFDRINGNLVIPAEFVKRWERQINTPYKNLSEEEKESDRKEARKILKFFNQE
ncbi:MAG: hypothetical protein ACOCP4_00980 [Candidatus Woesearchaeota archaeon]